MSPLFNGWHLMLVSYRITNSLCHLLQMWDVAASTDMPGTVQESWSHTTHTSVQGWEIIMIYVIHQLLRCAPLGYPIIKDTILQETIIFRSFQGNSMRKKRHLPGTDMEDNVLWLNWNYNTIWQSLRYKITFAMGSWMLSKVKAPETFCISISKIKNCIKTRIIRTTWDGCRERDLTPA